MYARVWRRWSLNTNRMSFLWLAAVTLLLLILCAPTTTTTTTFAMTTTIASRQNAAGAAAAVEAKAAVVAASAASYTYNRGRLWQRWPSRPSAAAAVAAEDAGVAERSFFIPVRANAEESSGSSSNAASRPASYQLQPPKNSPSSRNRSCSSSSSKIPSSSKLFRSSFQQQQQKRLQQQQQQHADRLAQSQYYKTPATAAQKPSATVFANSNNSPPTALREQQHIYVAHEGADYEEDEEVDEEEAGDDEGVDDEINEENENEDEAESEADTSEEHVADNADLATFNNNFNRNSKLVPSDASSQANTLYNRLVRQRQPTPQLQRQSPGNTAATTTRAHNTKARRHVQQSVDVNHKKLHQQQQQQKQLLPATGFHSPVRETATVSSNPSSPTARTRNKSATLPFRYFIETFEIPATLPFTGDLTQQQRLMLLQSEQLRRWQLDQQQQQQAARSRRDSRPFVGLSTAGSSSGSNSYQQQHYYSAQQQQQLQLQPYQRVQHQQHLNPSNTFYPKQHHKTHSNQQEQQHQHQNQMHHQHQHQHPHQRNNRRRRYCSARDPAQLAFEAPTVFEGKIVSMTPDRTANFSATVEVKEIFKQQIGYRLQRYLRLQFTYRNTSGECDIYREQLRPRGLVRGDELEQGRIYLLFVQQIDLGNFTILGQPIRKTRRVVEAVKNAVSENYAQLAAIRSITASNRTVENGKELRIVCKVQGRPPPKVTWFKDHKSINRNRRLYQIVPYKKRSELIIKSFNSSDAGRYECRAKNKVNRNLERRAIVIKAYPVPRYETHLTGGTGHTCPPDAAEFCFNGGTCKLFVEIGSYSCICPEGFIGERCDRKEVNNMPPNPTYKTGYIADDPNAYDAKQHFDTDKSGAAENPSPPVDSANDDSEEEDDSLEEY